MTPRERAELSFAAGVAAGGHRLLTALVAGDELRGMSLDELAELEAELRKRWPALWLWDDQNTRVALTLLAAALGTAGQAQMTTDEERARTDDEAQKFLGMLELRRMTLAHEN